MHHDDPPSLQDGASGPPPDAPLPQFTFSVGLLADPDADPDGHRREWFRVYEHFTSRLHGYWKGRLPHDPDRDEVIQNTWVRTAPGIRKLQAPGQLWNWLRTVSERAFIDFRRRRGTAARRAEVAAGVPAEDLMGRQPRSALEHLEAVDEVAALLAGDDVSERDEQMARMWMAGATHAEMAARLNLPSEEASRAQWARLLRRLRRARE